MKSFQDPDANLKPSDVKRDVARFFRPKLKVNKPLIQTIEKLLDNGHVIVETNFDMNYQYQDSTRNNNQIRSR